MTGGASSDAMDMRLSFRSILNFFGNMACVFPLPPYSVTWGGLLPMSTAVIPQLPGIFYRFSAILNRVICVCIVHRMNNEIKIICILLILYIFKDGSII